MRFRGIDYDTGTFYLPGADSRPDWSPGLLRRHLRTIRDDLHANAVTVFGSRPGRLAEATGVALELGLHVWAQPRLPDATVAATLAGLRETAAAIEPLRAAGGSVRLNVGCELTLFTAGLMPGRDVAGRARRLTLLWPLLPLYNRRLNRVLRRAAAVAREHFGGELTYGAGTWETVSWEPFDAVGLNHYRDRHNRRTYAATLAAARRHARPVLITEFGCCAYPGADARGSAGDAVVDWNHRDGPVVRPGHPRDEAVQARYLDELLDVFDAAEVEGAFVFEYSEPLYERRDDPRRDLDIGGFGLVAVRRGPDHVRVEEPRAAFATVARRFAAAARGIREP